MTDLEIFDKNGTPLNISEVVSSFLKDNLSIQLSTSKEFDFGDEYTLIEVSISLGDDEICRCNDRIR